MIPSDEYLTLVMSSTETLNEIRERRLHAIECGAVPFDQIPYEKDYCAGIEEIINERLLTSLVMSESTTLD